MLIHHSDLRLSNDNDDNDDNDDYSYETEEEDKKKTLKKSAFKANPPYSKPKPTPSKKSKTTMTKMILPFIKFGWEDSQEFKCVTVIVQLPSVAFRKGSVTGVIKGNRRIILTFDYSRLVILDLAKYGKAFKDNNNQPLYDESHIKTVMHKNRIRDLKGNKSALTKLKAEMTIDTGIDVENEFTKAKRV